MNYCLACGRPKGYDGCEHCNKLAEERIKQQTASANEDIRRLSRYDRAVELLWKSDYALLNLYALVKGECPSLLENDHHDDMVQDAAANTLVFLAEEPK